MERKTGSYLPLPRDVCRLSILSLWVNAVQKAPLALDHLHFEQRE